MSVSFYMMRMNRNFVANSTTTTAL